MSATAHATRRPTAFAAACLLPPAAAKPAASERGGRHTWCDRLKAWRLQALRVLVAGQVYKLRLAQNALANAENGPRVDHRVAWRRYLVEVDRLMCLPATSKEALRLKCRHRGLDGGRPEWDAAITADARRLEG